MDNSNEIVKVIDNCLAINNTEAFLKTFFPNAYLDKSYNYNGIEHPYIASGGQRNVYVHPNLEYVIKVPHDGLSGYRSNAWEYYAYLEDKYIGELPTVKTELIQLAPCIIKQDFLVVFNTSRIRINPILKDIFKPEYSRITEVYGFQYGWNKNTNRIEIYDTADALLAGYCTPVEFDMAFSFGVLGFKNIDFVKNLEFKNNFYLKLKDAGLFDSYLANLYNLNCKLKHQDGLLLDGYEETIFICGNVQDEPEFNDIFINVIEPNYKFVVVKE